MSTYFDAILFLNKIITIYIYIDIDICSYDKYYYFNL